MHLPDLSLPITDPVLMFALVMLMTLVLPLLFQRIRVPGIVGLIIAGVIVGPHALGVLARDQTMELLGTVGLLYIMFIAGLEVDMNEFNRQRKRSLLFGSITFVLPQGLGALMGHYMLGFDWPSAILLGAVFASHTLLAYPIVSRLGLAKGEAVTTGIGATILTDIAALLVLAVIVRTAEGALTPLFWFQMTVLLAVYVVGVLWGVPRLGRWFFQKVRSNGALEFVFVLAVVFVCAFLAGLAGVEPIIGAFLAGLALNRLVPEHSTLMNRTRFVGESLFIPFFLLSVGMLVDVRVLVGRPEAWTVAGFMLGTVLLTKWLAAQSTRLFFGYSADQGWMLFGLTVPQAAATLATVLIGYNVGIFDDSVLNGTILMMLVTCMIGPWVAEHYGRRVALQAERTPFEPSHAPQRILVPLANPETAPSLMDMAFMIWLPTSEQPIYPLAIVRNLQNVQGGVSAAEKLLGHAVVHAAAADVPVNPVVRIDRNVASGILRAVQENLISTVIIGWNGKSSGRQYTFGSVLDQLLQETQELMLVSKIEQPLATVERVVLILPPHADLDPSFVDIVRTVKMLASQMSARVRVLASDESMPAVERCMEATKPVVPVVYQALQAWSRLVSAYAEDRKPHDLLFLATARQGTLAWRPALSRLPRLLSRQFSSTNLVVCFPPVPVEDAYPSYSLPSGDLVLGGLISTGRIKLDLHGHTTDEVLSEMLRATLLDRPDLLRESTDVFQFIEADYMPELMPGVVLYHAHVSGIKEPLLFIGVSARGLNILKSSGLLHVVLLLLSPEGGSPEVHLRSLALVARLVRGADTIDKLRAASSPEDVRGILTNSLLAPGFGGQARRGRTLERLRNEGSRGVLYESVGVLITPQSDLVPLFSEVLHRTISFGKRMSLLHAGARTTQREDQMKEALKDVGLSQDTPITWVEGERTKGILELARQHEIDLLMVEAFDDTHALGIQLGPTAQALVRRSVSSLLLLTRPRLQPILYRRIAVVTEYDEDSLKVYRKVLRLAARERAEKIYVVRVRPAFGEARILARDQGRSLTEEQDLLEDFVHAGGETDVPVEPICLEGQTGIAATKFSYRYKTNLLVIPSLKRYAEVADRFFPSEQGWGLQEAACDVWIARETVDDRQERLPMQG
jgi:Kef-type K+ transport system membrane component KefB/mannitol/fructose-specific phosphotransferase system IIA component (Ntr-type)